MITFVESKDACTDFYANKNLYYIYYNDVDASVTTSNRYRWNIAHELGHILLKHHVNNQKTRIFRSSLTDTEYNELEAEADYFAQLILVPHAVLIGFKVDTYRTIRYMCKISDPAAKRRFYEYSIWKNISIPMIFMIVSYSLCFILLFLKESVKIVEQCLYSVMGSIAQYVEKRLCNGEMAK